MSDTSAFRVKQKNDVVKATNVSHELIFFIINGRFWLDRLKNVSGPKKRTKGALFSSWGKESQRSFRVCQESQNLSQNGYNYKSKSPTSTVVKGFG